MLRTLVSKLRPPAPPPTLPPGGEGPYGNPGLNHLYQMLFCDRPELFMAAPGQVPAPWQQLLRTPSAAGLQSLLADRSQDARVHALAWRGLQALGQEVPARQLLGTVFEVPMEDSQDTLAAYADGSVRLLHHRGPPAFFEGPVEALQAPLARVMATAQAVVARIGPSDQPRRTPPRAPNMRISFIVSDGLYFGEGPMPRLQADGLAGPLLAAGAELLTAVVELARPRS